MNLAISFGSFCLLNGTNGFDYSRIWDDPRGMSGSDLGAHRIAQELQKLGHNVTLFTFPKPGTSLPDVWEGLRIRHYNERGSEHFDCFTVWNEPDVLHAVDADLRICSLQINSIVGTPSAVDGWLSPSQWHLNRLHAQHPSPWYVVPDGTDLEPYDRLLDAGVPKVPGRVVWTSSPDRGLHWLLQEWPLIKRAVPHANLRVFYTLKPWLDRFCNDSPGQPDIKEQQWRAKYIAARLPTLKDLGVEVFDSVSRKQIVLEVAQAETLAYSADTVAPTEGFSCSTLEACAARACPITTAVDAFPEVYGAHLDLVPMPFQKHAHEFRAQVIRALTDPAWRDARNAKARALAEKFTWALAAKRLADVIEELAGARRAAE